MTNRFTDWIDVLRGAFRARFMPGTLTADRQYDYPDDDGQVVLVNPATQTFAAAVSFRKISIAYATQAMSGSITFTIAPGTKLPGAVAIYRLVADGINTPSFSAFRVVNTDTGYDNRSGIVNVIKFTFDGTDHWFEIWQEKGALPTFNSIGLTFPTRAGVTITNVGQVYTPASSAASFDAFMSSAQAIPQNKAGRITVKVADVAMVALCDTAIAESWTTNNFEYFGWRATTNAFSGSLGTAVVDSGVAMTNPGWLRLTRASTGFVTAECSNDGTTWTLYRTFATPTLVPLWITCNLSGSGQKTLEVIAFEVEP
jgi:hypothetical protein